MMSMTRFRRFTAAASLTALAVSGVAVATTTSAFGVDQPGPGASATPNVPAIPDTADLTIHKHKTPKAGAGEATDGAVATTAPEGPLKDVVFTIYRVDTNSTTGIDLKTNAGWAKAETLATAFKANQGILASDYSTIGDYTLTKVEQAGAGTTGEDGSTTFSNLPAALYVVVESDNTGAKELVNGKWEDIDVKGAAPFVVAVPMTDPANRNAWLSTVHVYPKNTPTNDIITKQVTDAGIQRGQDVTYTVTTGIDGNNAKTGITQYVITDDLDSHVSYKADSATVRLVDASGQEPTVLTTVTLDTNDYEVTPPTSAEGGTLTVTFTESGRKKLAQAKAGSTEPAVAANENAKVELSFKVTVKDLPYTGVLENTAYVFPNDTNVTDKTTGQPSNTTESKWGKIKFKKTASDGTTALTGAEFILTDCDDPAHAPITVGGNASWSPLTEDQAAAADKPALAKGEFEISGIHVSDFKDGKEVTDSKNKTEYCLYETKAPEGYELLTEPAARFSVAQLTVSEADKTKTFGAMTPADGGVIKNYPKNGGFNLPLTGAQGLATAGIAGALLVAGGYVLVVRRRREEQAA